MTNKFKTMRFSFYKSIFLFGLFSYALSGVGFAQQATKVVPDKSQGVVTIKGTKSYTYYKLSDKKSTSLNINGPGKLTVIARVLLKEGEEKSLSFKIKYVKDEKKQTVKEIGSLKVTKDFQNENKPVSVSEQLIINVPPGKHTYNFNKIESGEEICINFSYVKEPDPEWSDIKPINKLTEVSLLYNDTKKARMYYRISDKESFKVMLKPGDHLRLLVRSEFKQNDLPADKFRLILKQNDIIKNTFDIKTKRCEKVVYQNEQKLIPGTLDEIYIKIPTNKAATTNEKLLYEIILPDKSKTALIRLSVDQPLKPIIKQ